MGDRNVEQVRRLLQKVLKKMLTCLMNLGYYFPALDL